ncbi:MAG TPA: hypothetical protein PKI11_07765 [Candidatus Hydrogenedentes bacterium]|nr:hypothetical protein [Candidatus Hydrogenedentota bacterium]HNT89617.1 hypothetical protein [Candidatus Hydrogenedentota bacterium]
MDAPVTRPHKPVKLDDGAFEALPFPALIEQVRKEPAFADAGRSGLTLVRDPAMTVVLTVMRAGATLAEHRAPGPITVVVLEGSISFASGARRTTLRQGMGAVCARGLPHTVEAIEDTAFLIILGGAGA